MLVDELMDADQANTALIRKERSKIIVDVNTSYDDMMRIAYNIND